MSIAIHDGAYGTLLEHHVGRDEPVDALCLSLPHVVLDAHRAYVEAGASELQSCSFLVHLLDGRRRRRTLAAALDLVAEEAAEGSAGVGGAVGWWATIGPAGELAGDWHELLEIAFGGGATRVVAETLHSPAMARAALAAFGDVAAGDPALELRASCTVSPSRGRAAWRWVVDLAEEHPSAVALNCCEGPDGLRPVLEALVAAGASPAVLPSAGIPTMGDARPASGRYPYDHGSFAAGVVELVEGLQVAGIGGCCGTTPAHVAALAEAARGGRER